MSWPRFRGGRQVDNTEIDMSLGDANVESKLTERDFTWNTAEVVEQYDGLFDVFVADLLPRNGDEYGSYQLIRNVLAIAPNSRKRFAVLVDARRPDLVREWWTLHAAIREGAVRARCGLLFWQEIAAAAPAGLRAFLSAKYGL